MPRKVRLSKRPAVPSLLVAMRWVFKHPASEDTTEEQRNARRMLDKHLKEFMARMGQMEAAMKAAYIPNETKAKSSSGGSAGRTTAASGKTGSGTVAGAEDAATPSPLAADEPWERTKELILGIIEEAKR